MQQGTPTPMELPPPISSGQGSGRAPRPQVVNHITYNNNGVANDPGVHDMTTHLTAQYANIPAVSR